MADILETAQRDQKGKRGVRRLREQGHIPAILYGHGETNVSLAVPAAQVLSTIRHGHKLVELKGVVNERALIRAVQWDPFGMEVLHVDFFRVSAGESVKVTVSIELRGEAPGIREGGVVEHVLHEVDILCPVDAIPDRFELRLNDLHLGGELTFADLPLPEGAKLLSDPTAIIVHCVTPKAEAEEAGAPAESIEPELIGKKEKDEEEGAEE